MKLRRWLILSFCVNLLLVGVAVRAAKSDRPPAGSAPAIYQITNRGMRARPETAPAQSTVVEVPAPFDWRQIESADYRQYVENLRTIGCPEATIRDIIVADVNELFAGRIKALVDGVTGRFWNLMLNEEEMKNLVEEKLKELNAFADERKEIFEAVLGQKDLASQMREEENRADRRADWKQALDFLPADKAAKIVELKDRFQIARVELSQASDQRDQKRKELDAEEELQIQSLLSPEEFDEYKLRTSPAADLRSQLADFDATEEELRAIVRLKTNRQDDGQTKQLLGAERFAAYQRASDDAYQQALRITDRFELPAETAVQVYQMRKEAEAQADIIRKDATRPAGERQAILKAMQAETEKSIAAVLDSKAFAAYQKYGDGWLSRLADGVR